MTPRRDRRDTALVTGAAGRIGRALVDKLVADGFEVAAVDKTPATYDSANVVPIVADLADPADRARLVEQARRALGRVRCLVNNAADATEQTLLASTDEDWRRILEVNVVAPVSLVRLLAEDLRDGVVVNISSVRGLQCLPGAAPYEASKSALLAVTRSIAVEMGHRGTRAVTVCPGAIVDDPDTWLDEMPEHFGRAWTATQPTGKAGSTAAVADTIAFLLSDGARHINGTEVVVDGGGGAQYPATAALRMAGHYDLP